MIRGLHRGRQGHEKHQRGKCRDLHFCYLCEFAFVQSEPQAPLRIRPSTWHECTCTKVSIDTRVSGGRQALKNASSSSLTRSFKVVHIP
jgi:hypothetical protein